MKRRSAAAVVLGVLVPVLFAAGCLTIVGVTQPSQVGPGMPFQITVNFYTAYDASANNQARFGAVMLPSGFTVTNVTICGTDPLPYDAVMAARIQADHPADAGYFWWAGTTVQNSPQDQECDAVVSIIAGGTAGDYYLDYTIGYYADPVMHYEDWEYNQALAVGSAADTDGDGMPDGWEDLYPCVDRLTGDSTLDPDADTFPNLAEYQGATDPCVAEDGDGDGMPDVWENAYPCMLPGTPDAGLDYDADTLSNLAEYQQASDPCVPNDADGDGMPDWWEDQYGCVDRLTGDSTLDPDGDLADNLLEYQEGLLPCDDDSDGDGMTDGWELGYACVNAGYPDGVLDPDLDFRASGDEFLLSSDPCVAEDTDSDGMPDGWEDLYACVDSQAGDSALDPDADTLSNLNEFLAGTDPCVVNDRDGDGMPDHWENLYVCVDALTPDGGLDPDGDFLTNLQEYGEGGDPCVLTDTDGDGMPDGWEDMYACVDRVVGDSTLNPDHDAGANLNEYLAELDPCSPDTDLRAPVSYSSPDIYAVAVNPFRITRGDFNSDGYADIVAVNAASRYSILLNSGLGGFTAADYLLGGQMRDVIVVPLAGDAIPDLVISDFDGDYIRVRKGNGDGTFSSLPSVATGDGPDGIVSGDFNGDGLADVAVCIRNARGVGVLLGNAGGSFNPVTPYALTQDCMELAAGLVNGDSVLDLVTANWTSDSISVLLGNGSGGFGTPVTMTVGNDNSDVFLEDLNGDGLMDAAVTSEAEDNVILLLGDGAGNFSVYKTILVGTDPCQVRTGDLNGDGIVDLAVVNRGAAPGLSVVLGNGHGHFTSAYQFHPDVAATGLVIGNFDLAGLPEIATAHPNASIRVISGISLDSDNDLLCDLDEMFWGSSVLVPDSDGDGMPDGWEAANACLTPLSANAILDPDLDGTNNLAEYLAGEDPCFLEDLDGDGLLDVVELGMVVSAGPDGTLDTVPGPGDSLHDNAIWLGSDLWPGSSAVGDDYQIIPPVPDHLELFITNPASPDSDGDGFDDRTELFWGANPVDSAITPVAAIPLHLESGLDNGSFQSLAWTGSEFALVGRDDDIMFQRFSAAGEPIGAAVRVSTANAAENEPALVWTGTEFGASWVDGRDGNREIYFARLAADGSVIGTEARLSTSELSDEFPAIAWSGSEFGVIWNYYTSPNRVFFSRVSAQGVQLGSVVSVSPSGGRSDLIWKNNEWAAARSGYITTISSDGSQITAHPTLALGGDFNLDWSGSEYGIVYIKSLSGPVDPIVFSRLFSDGRRIEDETRIVESTSADRPRLTTADHAYGIAWYGELVGPHGSQDDIQFAMISDLGKPLMSNLVVSDDPEGNDFQPDVVWNGYEFGITWRWHFAVITRDSDGDGLTDAEEHGLGSEQYHYDTDYDRIRDGWENLYVCVDLFTGDSLSDPDSDSASNMDEYLSSTDPCDDDSDDDGLTDGYELSTSLTDPNDPDSDDDGLSDGDEVNTYFTDPLDPDSDDDGITDGWETAHWCLDPHVPDSSLDDDGEGLINSEEFIADTDPCDIDTDHDGLIDRLEVQNYGSDPHNPDSDGDSLSDAFEVGVVVGAGPDQVLATAPAAGDSIHDFAIWAGQNLVPDTAATDDDPQIIPIGYSWPRYFLTDPNQWDSDGDGVGDNMEIQWGANPLDPAITPLPAKIGSDLQVADLHYHPAQSTSLVWTGSEFGLTWTDDQDYNLEVLFGRISALGEPIGDTVRITNAPSSSINSTMVWTESEYGIAWLDGRSQSSWEAFFNRLSPDGTPLGDDLQLSAGADIFDLALEWTGSEFGTAWYVPFDGSWFERVSAAGDTLGPPHYLGIPALDSRYPDLAWAQEINRYGLIYQDRGGFNVYFDLLTADGDTSGPPLPLNSEGVYPVRPAVVWSGSEFGAVWRGNRNGLYEVYFARISASGAKIGQEVQVSYTSPAPDGVNPQYPVSLIWTGREYAVAWEDFHFSSPGKIQFILVTATGQRVVGSQLEVASAVFVNSPSLAWTGSEFGISWINPDVYFARIGFDHDGDGLMETEEAALGTDGLNFDSDFDWMDDGWEADNPCLGPLVNDSAADGDGDGVSNLEEYVAHTNPCPSIATAITVAASPNAPYLETVDITYRVFDQKGFFFDQDNSTRFSVTATGLGVFNSSASRGTVLGGGGTDQALVQVENGEVEIGVSVSGPGLVCVGALDSESVGLAMPACVNIEFWDPFMVEGSTVMFYRADDQASLSTCRHIIAGRFDGDLFDDAVVADYSSPGAAAAIPGELVGTLGPRYAETNMGGGVFGLNGGDFNEDGCLDLAASDFINNQAKIALGDCAGAFGAPVSYPVHASPRDPAVGDINQDLDLDIVVPNETSLDAAILLGDGTGGFSTPSHISTGVQSRFAELGFINSDSYLDLAIAGWDGNISTLLGDGAGGFGTPSVIASGANVAAVRFGEFTGDACNDLVAVCHGPDDARLYQGDCLGGFAPLVAKAVGSNPHGLVVQDFNMDGKLDFAAAIRGNNRVTVYQGDGSGDFVGPFYFSVGTDPWDLAEADVNHDGKPDLLVVNGTSGTVTSLINITPGGGGDADGDGLNQRGETYYGTNGNNADTDADGLNDGDEIQNATDPVNADTDDDGIGDGDEVNIYFTGPLDWDTDGDYLSDGCEVMHGASLDPLDPADAALDPDGDGNASGHEYWNGSDPWRADPVPQAGYEVGCYYWGKSDGGIAVQPGDIVAMQKAYVGVSVDYARILPQAYDPLDLDRDMFPGPGDIVLAQGMYVGLPRPGGYVSSPAALTVEDAPVGPVAVGDTTHVTVSVHAAGPGAEEFSPGMGVVFWVESGNAVLLGGEGTAPGEAAGNRYDVSMRGADGAPANVVVLVTGAGPISINVKIPACGTEPLGRWCGEITLPSAVVVNP